MGLIVYHEFDHDGRHYKLVFDEEPIMRQCGEYGTRCSCKEEEDKAQCSAGFEETYQKIESGEWVNLGAIVTAPCSGRPAHDGQAAHCECCSGTRQVDSLWGIVVENDECAAQELVIEMMG